MIGTKVGMYSSGGDFVPTDISGLNLWLDGNDASTITLNGSDVSQWDDKSGNDYHALQGIASDQPLYNATGMNGRGTVDFDASNTESMFTNPDAVDYPLTIFVACETFSSKNHNIIVKQSGAANGGILFRFFPDDVQLGTLDLGVPFPRSESTATSSINTPFIAVGRCDITDGSKPGTTIGDTAFTDSADSISGLVNVNLTTKIGVRPDVAENWLDGRIAEMIIYDSVLSDADKTRVINYLNSKWNI